MAAAIVLVGAAAASTATAQADPPLRRRRPRPRRPSTPTARTRSATDIQPGRYSSAGPVGDGACYWKRVNGTDIVDNALSKKAQIVQIEPTDTAFTTNECQPWQLTDAPLPAQRGPAMCSANWASWGRSLPATPRPPPPSNP